MKFKVLIVFFSLVLLGSYWVLHNNKGTSKAASRFLVVGTSADYPPYATIDTASNEIVGFDIDVVSEVAKRLGKGISIKDMPFACLIFALLSQDVDVIAAGMSPSEQRKNMVDFSDLYVKADPFVIVTLASSYVIKDIEGLQGKKVAVNTGYTAEAYLADQKDIDLVRLVNPAESLLALKSGAVDAFVCAKSIVDTMFKQVDSSQYQMFVIPQTGDGCALVVNKKNKELLDEINKTLEAIRADGTMSLLQKKWNVG